MADRFPSSPCNLEICDGTFNIDPRFTNLHPLCYGGNGIVFSAMDNECEKNVAIKKLTFCDKKTCKYALREIKIIRRLQHENIVTVYEILGPDGRKLNYRSGISYNELTSVYLVQELLDIDLLRLIQNQLLTPDHVQLFMYQLMRGLKYIHSANVVHRDLKPANLLINVEDLLLKIGDFGLARVVDTDYSHKGFLTDGVGTCWYRSPELIISPRDYTKALDVWSAGCILAEMLARKPLFCGSNEMDQIGQILDIQTLTDNEWNKMTQVLPKSVLRHRSRLPKISLRSKFKDISSDALNLLENMLVFNPDKRMSAEEALTHPYLQKYSCPEDEPEAYHSFHIENEVDELSPTMMRKLIEIEAQDSVDICGHYIPKIKSPNVARKEVSKNEKKTKSSSNEQLTNNKNTPSENSQNKNSRSASPVNVKEANNKISESTTQVEIIDQGNNDNKSSPLPCVQISEKELSLRIIVELPDDENRKEELSPKEREYKEHLESSEEKVKEADDLFEKEQDTAEVDKPVIIVHNNVSNDRDDKLESKLCKDLDLILHLDDAVKSKNDSKPGVKHKQQNMIKRKVKDRLNEEKRAESPRDMVERHNRDNCHGLDPRGRACTGTHHKENRIARNNKSSRYEEDSDRALDFDSMYRLPTEHLLHSRFRRRETTSSNKVENQLKLHEQLNSRLKLAELERDRCIGAMGGVNIDSHEDSLSFSQEEIEPRSRSSSGSSGTESGNFTDFVPRRFER